jgi:hypothetical protein
MRATLSSGKLKELKDCYIITPFKTVVLKILPELSDSKGASFNSEAVPGRAFPLKNFANGDERTIGWTVHFMVTSSEDIPDYLESLDALRACVYPRDANLNGAPFGPPPICQIRCGQLLGAIPQLCVVLRNYSFKADPTVPWDEETYLPYKFDVDLQFEVVYESARLPGADSIFNGSR